MLGQHRTSGRHADANIPDRQGRRIQWVRHTPADPPARMGSSAPPAAAAAHVAAARPRQNRPQPPRPSRAPPSPLPGLPNTAWVNWTPPHRLPKQDQARLPGNSLGRWGLARRLLSWSDTSGSCRQLYPYTQVGDPASAQPSAAICIMPSIMTMLQLVCFTEQADACAMYMWNVPLLC